MRRSEIGGAFELDDPLFSKCKSYESVANKRAVMFDKQETANTIVKAFIQKRGLILYGGEAIDGALRERGGFLYEDDAVPDYDFFSANPVEDAYDLADELYAAGCEEARAIAGMHFGTMRVDAGANNFVADLSLVPENLFDAIPTITHDGARGVHPAYQRADIHRALSLPYVEAPREVIFNRLAKDIARFNLLGKYYPVTEMSEFLSGDTVAGVECVIPKKYLARPLTGIVASRIYRGLYGNAESRVVAAAKDGLHVVLPALVVERISTVIPAVSFWRFAELVPSTHEEIAEDGLHVITAGVSGKIIPVLTTRVNGLAVVLAGVQHVLWWLIAHFWAVKAGAKTSNLAVPPDVYLSEYLALYELVSRVGDDIPELAPWLPSYYGDLNESATEKLAKLRTAHDRDPRGTPKPPTPPKSYSPAKKSGKHPPWNNSDFEKAGH